MLRGIEPRGLEPMVNQGPTLPKPSEALRGPRVSTRFAWCVCVSWSRLVIVLNRGGHPRDHLFHDIQVHALVVLGWQHWPGDTVLELDVRCAHLLARCQQCCFVTRQRPLWLLLCRLLLLLLCRRSLLRVSAGRLVWNPPRCRCSLHPPWWHHNKRRRHHNGKGMIQVGG